MKNFVQLDRADFEDFLDEIKQAFAEAHHAQVIDPDALLTADKAGKLLGMSEEAIRTAAARGEIPSIMMPVKRLRFRRDELLKWAYSQT